MYAPCGSLLKSYFVTTGNWTHQSLVIHADLLLCVSFLVQSRHKLLKYKQSSTCKVWPSANRLAREVEVVLVEMGIDTDGRQEQRVTRAETPGLRRMSARFF